MPERVKELQRKFLEYWNKFDKRQKQIIISVVAVVLIAFGVLGFVVSRAEYETLITVTSQSDAAQVKNLLVENSYDYKISDDTLTFYVNKKQKADALLLLAENRVPKGGYLYDLSEITGSGGLIPLTEAARKLNEKVYKEQKIEQMISANEYIKWASVELSIPETSYLVLKKDEESSASVWVELEEELPPGVGENLAKSVAYMLGNETTDHIIIVDTKGNLIFAGGVSEDDTLSSVNSQISAREEMEKSFSNKVKNLLMASNIADTVSVSTTLEIDFSTSRTESITYSVADDMKQGYWSERHTTSSENTNGAGGVPGTASNDSDDVTTYEISSGSGSSSTETVDEYYLVDQLIQENESKGGVISLGDSSISVTLTKVKVYSEEELRALGELDEMTYQEYQYEHNETMIGTVENGMVDPALITHVSKAAGIPEDRISVMVYLVPFFQSPPDDGFKLTDYLQLIVFIIIVALLAFVVWRSTRSTVVVESEPELSVEQLLAATTPGETVEDIDLQDKSEARKAIEKFVDENPQAVALLLRNWLETTWD